ncbi:hypothetical protein [Bifidobacterium platyrrhinorum]|uniref:Uncharacterized protein n=1 Tax=Bifidobacterium platyrrhinorum TaxID=2661628 RepID=A0A6L9SS92_9BIFI|nr:hypothetical protein [Bifidobacterium platyrrhinorum]NEG55420.1 hypothetical protein [Bifidobacterium platyrrhinorum]
MSVKFYMMRKDIPDDCRYDVCQDADTGAYYSVCYSDYCDAKGYRVSVSYLHEDELKAEYPALYPAFFEGKKCKQVTYRLGLALRKCRANELKHYVGYLNTDDRLYRINRMLSGLSQVLKICLDHPDWKLVTES